MLRILKNVPSFVVHYDLGPFTIGLLGLIEDADERLGVDIVQKAPVAPASLIAQNVGIKGEVVVEKVKASEWEICYNAMTNKYENLVEAGVIDPAKVTRCALQNSASVAGMVLTIQAIVMEKPKPKAPTAGHPSRTDGVRTNKPQPSF